LIIDDYAHHPSEVKATLKSLKEAYPEKRIYTVFQPHTYSRTEEFKNEFIETLTLSDKVMLIDIFGSAREKKGNITSKDLAEEIRKYNKEVKTAKDTDTAISIIKDELVPGDLLLTMGAGETWKVAEAIHKLYG
jgi:UDP-N-acetylmuramate--alanine ligase